MAKQNISQLAKANGVHPATAHGRIKSGWTTKAATSTPSRPYRQSARRSQPTIKADQVWAYLVSNPLAHPTEVAKATGVSYPYAYKLLKKVGTPREVFEAEAAAKVDVTEDVSLEQFVKDDTSPFPPRWLLIGVAIVAVFVAMAMFT